MELFIELLKLIGFPGAVAAYVLVRCDAAIRLQAAATLALSVAVARLEVAVLKLGADG